MSAGIDLSDGRMFWYEEAVVEDYKLRLRIKVSEILSVKYQQLFNFFMVMGDGGRKAVDMDYLRVGAKKIYESPEYCPNYPRAFMRKYRKKFPTAKYLSVKAIQKELARLEGRVLAEADKKLPAAIKERDDQIKRNNLASYCLIFADRKGKITEENHNSFWSAARVECEDGDIKIHWRAQQSGYGNGSCNISVSFRSKIVLKAIGNFIGAPNNVEFTKYVPGPWEKIVTSFAKPIKDANDKK